MKTVRWHAAASLRPTFQMGQLCGWGSVLGLNGTADTLNTYATTGNCLENRVDVPCIL